MDHTLNRSIIILTGPTGVGKSALAEQLALQHHGAIINADMGQMYIPLSIGTAKPEWHNSVVPHFLFDIIDTPRYFSVAQYRTLLFDTIEHVTKKGLLPIVVGGSLFYLKSLFFPPQSPSSGNELEHVSWSELHRVDPLRAQAIHKNDTYRIARAYSIWRDSQKKPSGFVPHFDMPFQVSLCFVSRCRAQLYNRIDQRVVSMVNSGWIDEVRSLMGTAWEPFLKTKKIIGYPEILAYCSDTLTKKKAIELIQQKTRRYAKRQHTFWRSFGRQLSPYRKRVVVSELTLTHDNLDLYIEQLVKTAQ